MVFVVIAHVEGNDIQYAIVAKGFLLFVKGKIVLLDPAGAQGVKPYGEEEARKKIYNGFGAEGIPDAGCEGYFRQPVQRYPFIKGLDFLQAGNAKNLKNGIEQQPENFSDEIVIDQLSLPTVGEIGIQFVDPLERMMFDMVAFEGHAAGEDLGQVRQDTGEAV